MKTVYVIFIYAAILLTLTSEKPKEPFLSLAPIEKKEIRFELSQHKEDSLNRIESILELEMKKELINYKIDDISEIIENR